MAEETKKLSIHDLNFDARPLAEYLVDLEPGERQGLRVAGEDFPVVVGEVKDLQPIFGARAGITDEEVEEFSTAVDRTHEIDKHLRVARKIVEVLEESRAVQDDKAQRMAFGFAQIIEARARTFGDSQLLARYEKTRAYRSAAGFKAARTRRRNEEAELEQPGNDEPGNDEQPGALPVDETQTA
jgi:hypothetical protein